MFDSLSTVFENLLNFTDINSNLFSGSMNNLDRKTSRDEISVDSKNTRAFIPRVSPLPIGENYDLVSSREFAEMSQFKDLSPKDRRK